MGTIQKKRIDSVEEAVVSRGETIEIVEDAALFEDRVA